MSERKPTPRKKVKYLGDGFSIWRKYAKNKPGEVQLDVAGRALASLVFEEAVAAAYKKAKLDPKREGNDVLLLGILASGIYGGNPWGRPQKWTEEDLKQLMQDFDEAKEHLRKEGLKATEKQCCEHLIKIKKYQVSVPTLQRMLQDAKKLSREDGPKAQ